MGAMMERGSMSMEIPEGEQAYTVADAAYNEMLARGIKLPERPEQRSSRFLDPDGSPIIPGNIQDLTDRELGELYGILDEYYSYVSGQLADVQNNYGEATEKFEFVSARVRLTKGGPQKDKDDGKKTDRRYVEANSERLKWKCLFALMTQVVKAQEAKLKLVSRNITLRQDSTKKGTRRAAVEARREMSGGRTRDSNSTAPAKTRPAIARKELSAAKPKPAKATVKKTIRKKPRRPPPRKR